MDMKANGTPSTEKQQELGDDAIYNTLIAIAIIFIAALVAIAVFGDTTVRIVLAASVGVCATVFAVGRVLDKRYDDTVYYDEGEDDEDKCVCE